MADYPNENNPIRLAKLDCGKHSGPRPGPCRKCQYQDRLRVRFNKVKALTCTGRTWWVAIGEGK